ncbi:MAG: hypothetical protein HY323_14370 [Betaproteobacteria bacterium]|nr:hypothetical protein [Betaproteobacteria bacterium]
MSTGQPDLIDRLAEIIKAAAKQYPYGSDIDEGCRGIAAAIVASEEWQAREACLTFGALRKVNVARCEEVFHALAAWSLTDWATAAAGELGEACNIIKKMRRYVTSTNDPGQNIDPASDEGRRLLAHEIADVVIYLDLLAARAGIDLEAAVIEKFNLVSERTGSLARLAAVKRTT